MSDYNTHDPSKHLLSKSEYRRCLTDVTYYKNELEGYSERYHLYMKYHKNSIRCRAMGMTGEQMFQKAIELANAMESLKEDIDLLERKMYLAQLAREELRKAMKPFENIDLRKHPLVQLHLF